MKMGYWVRKLSDFESIPLDALVVDLGYLLKQPIW